MVSHRSLRCSFASRFDLGTNLRRSGIDLLQLSGQTRFRFSPFSNIVHCTEHRKTPWISTISQSSSLHARCEKRRSTKRNHVRKGELHRKTPPTFTSLRDPFFVKTWTLEAEISLRRAHQTAMPQKDAKNAPKWLQKGAKNEPKSTPKRCPSLALGTSSRHRSPR